MRELHEIFIFSWAPMAGQFEHIIRILSERFRHLETALRRGDVLTPDRVMQGDVRQASSTTDSA
jgi:hypothetical protein